jgi:protein-tyrosine phosphatase
MGASLLFLCTGNYWRSRFAEMLFNHLAERAGLTWRAASRGLALERGVGNIGPMAPFAIAGLRARGVPVPGDLPYPSQLAQDDLDAADLIIAMDEREHRGYLTSRYPGWEDRVTYWHVGDVDVMAATTACAAIEREVYRLIGGLSTGWPSVD